MDGSNNNSILADRILATADEKFDLALETAGGMSIRNVRETLEELVAPNDSGLCHRFLERWLSALDPVQRLAASMETSHLYLLDLVDVPHAEDIIVQRVLRNGAEAITALKSDLFSNRDLGRHPDSSFSLKFVKQLENDAEDPLDSTVQVLTTYANRLDRLEKEADQQSM